MRHKGVFRENSNAGENVIMSSIAHFSLAQYDSMIERGVFGSRGRQRLEFIRGEVREMTPIGSRHEEVVDRLNVWSVENARRTAIRVRIQNSIGVPELESAPEPDVAWVVERDYSEARPTAADVLLIIEVADSSLAYDTGEKAGLYAAAGVADYWVVDIAHRSIEVRRDPAAGRYRTLNTYAGIDEIHPLAAPDVTLRPALLWDS
jgi:Uma2 family endonuclease